MRGHRLIERESRQLYISYVSLVVDQAAIRGSGDSPLSSPLAARCDNADFLEHKAEAGQTGSLACFSSEL